MTLRRILALTPPPAHQRRVKGHDSLTVCWLAPLFLVGCGGFDPVSVYPRIVVQNAGQEILIYGSGFQEGMSGTLQYRSSIGLEDSAALSGFALLADPNGETEHTARAVLPALASEAVAHPVFPYQELVFYASSATPGLYACDTLEPVLWDPSLDARYCDANGQTLTFASPESQQLPPYDGESARDYAAWYDLLGACVGSMSPSSQLTEAQLSLLIPDYGEGCFYRSAPEPGETKFQYCPAYLAAVDVDVALTQGDTTVRLKNGITLLDLSLDYYGYYGNDAYSTQVRGMLGDMGGTPIKAPGDISPQLAVGASDEGAPFFAATFESQSSSLAVLSGLPDAAEDATLDYVGGVTSLTVGRLLEDEEMPQLVWAVPVDDGSDSGEGSVRYTSLSTASSSRTSAGGIPTAITPPVTLSFDNMVVTQVAVADLNGDGRADLITTGVYQDEPTRGRLAVLYRASEGTLESSPIWMDLSGIPSSLVVGELDQALGLDLVVLSEDADKLILLRNNGNRTFSVASSPLNLSSAPMVVPSMVLDPAARALSARLSDMTGNGTTDITLLVEEENHSVLWIYEGNGSGGIASARSFPVSFLAQAGTLGDGDGDGDLDVFLVSASGGSLMLRADAGLLTPAVETFAPLDAAAVVAHDFDSDGDTDTLVLGLEDGVISRMNNPSTLVEYFSDTLAGCAY